jgi:hypothetical protein
MCPFLNQTHASVLREQVQNAEKRSGARGSGAALALSPRVP